MRKLISLLGALAVVSTAAAQTVSTTPTVTTLPSAPAWQDPTVVSLGKEPPRAYKMSYTNRDAAIAGDFTKSEYYLPLNGIWKFFYTDDYRTAPAGFEKPGMNVALWDDIKVPGNWELQGHGTAIYTNHGYEFQPKNPQPPKLPDAVPMGIYRKEFDIPTMWRDRDIFLHLGGVKSGCYVYINGKQVGYTEDSKSAAEFNISKYVTDGRNTLVLQVMRWSTGSYLECQDFWRVSGLERDVYIYSQPSLHVEDFYVKSQLDSTYKDGVFDLKICLQNSFIQPSGELQVWFELLDPAGEAVDYSYREMEVGGHERDTVSFRKVIKNVRPWSAEDPYLYTLVLKVKQNKRFTEYITQKVGFRTSEIRGNQYLVNGKRVFIKGTNYHETHPVTGHYVDEATIIKDMELMKKANINAIRLCHYPQQRRFYELADQYGFYLCNEANIESHGMYYDLHKGGSLGNNPLWLNAHMDRTKSMYHQTKNYPSVMFWSLGNEAGNGYNFYETYLWLKSVDSLRPVQYERALLEWNTDIFCPQYPGAGALEQWGKMKTDRPYIASEYAHAMGNSTGNFKDQWDMIYKYPNLQGGFIWDWVDQGFEAWNADSTQTWYNYGGDYGKNSPSDGNFLCNGLVGPDREPHPGMWEVKKVHQYVQFSPVDLKKGLFMVKNIYDFTNLDKYSITASVEANGRVIATQAIPLSLAPDGEKRITVSAIAGLKPSVGTDYYVNFSVKLKNNDGLLKKGYEVAAEQFALPLTVAKTVYKASGSLRDNSEAGEIILNSSNATVVINKTSGLITTYNADGATIMADEWGLRPNFWRAPTDNDYGSQSPIQAAAWRDVSLGEWRAQSVTAQRISDAQVNVISKYSLPENTALTITYKVYASGAVNVNFDFTGNPSSETRLFRQGMRMRVGKDFSTLNYFGRGGVENYVDRKACAPVGLYKSDAKLEGTDYVRPQENGHHTDTRWLTLTRAKGGGVAVIADDVVEFNALTATMEDFDAESSTKDYQWNNFLPNEDHSKEAGYLKKPKQTHINDVPVRDFVELSVDGRMMGLGGDDSWYSLPYDQYLVKAKENFSYGFTLVPVRGASDAQRHNSVRY